MHKNVDFVAPQFSNWAVFTQALSSNSSLSISFDLVVMFVFVDEKVYYMSAVKGIEEIFSRKLTKFQSK